MFKKKKKREMNRKSVKLAQYFTISPEVKMMVQHDR